MWVGRLGDVSCWRRKTEYWNGWYPGGSGGGGGDGSYQLVSSRCGSIIWLFRSYVIIPQR